MIYIYIYHNDHITIILTHTCNRPHQIEVLILEHGARWSLPRSETSKSQSSSGVDAPKKAWTPWQSQPKFSWMFLLLEMAEKRNQNKQIWNNSFFLRIQNVEQHVRIFFSGIGYVFAWHDLFVDGSIPQFTDRNGYGMMHRNHPRCLMVQQKTSVDRIYI